MAASVEFDTTVAATGKNTGIIVPDDIIERLGAGRRPSVVVNVNDYEYRNSVGVMGGKHMISISAAVRKATGLKGGDTIRVRLTVADTPRKVEVPDDLVDALAANPTTTGVLRHALEQCQALPRRQYQRCQDTGDQAATCREGRRAFPRGEAPLSVGLVDSAVP